VGLCKEHGQGLRLRHDAGLRRGGLCHPAAQRVQLRGQAAAGVLQVRQELKDDDDGGVYG